MNKPKLGEVLRHARLKAGLTQVELADKAGISQPYYNLIENNKSRPPSFYVVEKLAQILKCDSKPLIKAVEIMQLEYKKDSIKKLEGRLGTGGSANRPIPILSDIPAGNPKDYGDSDYPAGIADEYYEFKVDDPNAFFLRAKGDCMAPYIIDGDLLLIYPNDKVESGDIAIVANDKDEKEVRRVTIEPDQIILCANNLAYPSIVWRNDKDKPKIIGRVKEIIRRR